MNLKNSLYHINGIKWEDRSASIELLQGCYIYKVHFPDRPITPGVCIIQMATELLEVIVRVSLALKEVVNAKFFAVIDPDVTKELNYNFQKITSFSDNSFKVSVIVADSTITYAKLSLVYDKNERSCRGYC